MKNIFYFIVSLNSSIQRKWSCILDLIYKLTLEKWKFWLVRW